MKRSGSPRRRKPLRSNAAKQREWEDRSRRSRLDRPEHAEVVRGQRARSRREAGEFASLFDESREYVKLRSHGICEANWPGVCLPGPHPGQHAHHLKLKGQGGPDTADNLVWICLISHRWIHDHPADARDRGLIRGAWS